MSNSPLETLETPNREFYDFVMAEYEKVIEIAQIRVAQKRSGRLEYDLYTITGLDRKELARVTDRWLQRRNCP